MPLNVIVIGAGIAGLTAATALSQDGHSVKIFEKSTFKTEAGAALNLMPNGTSVLGKLGFDFERALVGRNLRLQTVDGMSLRQLTLIDLSDIEKEFGGHMQSVLRADLHSELLRLSKQSPNPAQLYLGCQVRTVSSTDGIVTLESGDSYAADLIVASDGSHSVCREEVLGRYQPPFESGKNAFRFLVPTEKISNLEEIKSLVPGKVRGTTIFADVEDKHKTRHIAWYDCHGGAIQNLVGIYPASEHVESLDNKTMLLEQFRHFHPKILGLLRLAEDVRVWPLRYDDPFEEYTRGRLVLIGDAAHTMLPFSGQGANQAIEGAGTLARFFRGVGPDHVIETVKKYEELRKPRISLIKQLSRIRFGTENNSAYSLIQHEQINNQHIPQSFEERLRYEWGYIDGVVSGSIKRAEQVSV